MVTFWACLLTAKRGAKSMSKTLVGTKPLLIPKGTHTFSREQMSLGQSLLPFSGERVLHGLCPYPVQGSPAFPCF